MRQWLLVSGAAALVMIFSSATGCTVEKAASDDEGDGGSTATASGGSGSGSGVVSSSVSASVVSSSSGGACMPQGGLATSLGGDAACESCSVTACACEAEACEAAGGTGTSCDQFIACVQGSCMECFYQYCDAELDGNGIGFYFNQACATCGGTNCCDEIKACLAGGSTGDCWLCISGMDDTKCGGELDTAMDTCEADNCATECPSGG